MFQVFLRPTIALILTFCSILSANANTISGAVSLPPGVVAPSGGLDITVGSIPFDDFGFGRDRVRISAGQSSASYVLQFSDNSDRDITFDCEDCANLDVTSDGGWSNTQGVVGTFSGQTFSGALDHVVNIRLERADTFKGTVSLPSGVIATGGEFLFVSIRSTDPFSFDSFGDGELLSAGQTSFEFAIGAPSDSRRSGWDIRFVCLSCAPRVEPSGHFATTVAGGIPSLDSDSAFQFSSGLDFNGIDLTFIDNQAIPDESEEGEIIIAPILLLLDDID